MKVSPIIEIRKTTQRIIIMLSVAVLSGCASEDQSDGNPAQAANRPNILLIVADDLGYTDLGSFGGEIATPHLDSLARAGTRFTNFYAGPSCAPTRAMLLTGMDNHQVGMGSQSGLQTPQQASLPAYQNKLSPGVPTIAETLSSLGYQTLASAKWHLGSESEYLPGARGFDRSFVLLEGGSGHFDDTPPTPTFKKAHWLEDDKPFTLPDDFYSSDFMTDKLLEYLDEVEADQPFFAYMSYTAPHWPLQARRQDIERQAGLYDEGWDILRERRMEGARREGVVPATAKAVTSEAGMAPWDSLDSVDQAAERRKMEIYAAMIERMDFNIGRIVEHLSKANKIGNTLVVFISDNGAEAHQMETYPGIREWVAERFDNSLASMGSPDSYVSLGPSWARATAAPFRASKSKVSEGGIRVPAFILLPKNSSENLANETPDKSYMRVADLTPTFIELAGGQIPADMEGRSLWSRWHGESSPYADTDIVAFETYGRRGVHRGDWKLLLQEPPYGSGDWQLYNLPSDPGEQRDLSARYPEIKAELIAGWEAYAERVGVVLPEIPIRY